MNAYTTVGQARIHPRDRATIKRRDPFAIPASLAALERQRGWQADVEMDWLLQQHGAKAIPAASLAASLWQAIGAALVRTGERLAGALREAAS